MRVEPGDPVLCGDGDIGRVLGVFDENGLETDVEEEAVFCVVVWQNGSYDDYPLDNVETRRMN